MDNQLATITLLIANILFSYQGFKDPHYLETNLFDVDRILLGKEYKRLITSGFIHANWWHLGLNMMALHSFGGYLETVLGSAHFLIIYFASLLGGNLLALFIHRNHYDYKALGASGAVFGVVYSTIILDPDGEVLLFMLLPMAAWAYGILFMVISIYGVKSQTGNIGHDAHLGGAVLGMIAFLLFRPDLFRENFLIIAALLIPAIFFIFMIVKNPEFITFDSFLGKSKGFQTLEDKYNAEKLNKQADIDRILDKISKKGINSLTAREREILDKNK